MMSDQEIEVKRKYARKAGVDYEESNNLFLDLIEQYLYDIWKSNLTSKETSK